MLLWVIAQHVDDVIQLLSLRDLEHHLARLVRLRLAVEPQAEGAVEQLGQPCGKVGILRDDTNLRGAEGIAVEQNTVRLRPGATQLLHRQPAQLIFGVK